MTIDREIMEASGDGSSPNFKINIFRDTIGKCLNLSSW